MAHTGADAKGMPASLPDGEHRSTVPILHRSLRPHLSRDYEAAAQIVGDEVASKWAADGCGIAAITAAVDSVLVSHGVTTRLPAVTLACETHRSHAYRPGVGWIHRGLVDFAQSYGLQSFNDAEDSIPSIARRIIDGWLAIASVTLHFRGGQPFQRSDGSTGVRGKGGHLVVLSGVNVEAGQVTGFLVDDAQDVALADDEISTTIVPVKEFAASYSGKTIYLR